MTQKTMDISLAMFQKPSAQASQKTWTLQQIHSCQFNGQTSQKHHIIRAAVMLMICFLKLRLPPVLNQLQLHQMF